MKSASSALRVLETEIIGCRKCPRLVRYREDVAKHKRRSFADWDYWGKPVPGFGDPRAQLFILGLAPAAHGANRTGRMFTGDRSGDFLYAALQKAGFASQSTSTHRGDGLALHNAWISASVRCAPPKNRPLPSEFANCRPYFERELEILRPRALLILGSLAFNTYLDVLRARGVIRSRAAFRFAHAAEFRFPAPWPRLFASYHPSQQNTFTGKLTEKMLLAVLAQISRAIR